MIAVLAPRHLEMLLGEFAAIRKQAAAAIRLFDEGATLPFIARYRKEVTGGLTETQLKEIQDRRAFYEALLARKTTILESIREQGVLTAELEERIAGCRDRAQLEDLYLPFKPKRRTRAQVAREKGYGPLADLIWAHRAASGDAEAIAGASDILAERIAEHAPTREWVRQETLRRGRLCSRKKRGVEVERSKFEAYFDFGQNVSRVASHQELATARGESEGVLSVSVEVDAAPIVAHLDRTFNRPQSPHRALFEKVEADAYERLLAPSIENEVRGLAHEKAEEEAIRVFAENLRNLLLAPPVRGEAILGIDPGLRTGCKVAAIDRTGKFLENTVIYPERPDAAPALARLIKAHGVGRIAYGNGTGSRELEEFLRKAALGVPFSAVSEAGASVYSASEVAVREFAHLDVTVRGAISIARRLQDPLAELVKIDPKAIGVGQYQHDVNEEKLKRELDHVVESCVNQVGVDVNTASAELLSYVAGLTRAVAEKIVAARPFRSREDLKRVPRLGPKAWEQAAGFLRIPGAPNPLDASAVHPESYYVVEKIARKLGKPVTEIVAKELAVRPEDFVDDRAGLPTVRDILEELRKPGRDPRKEFVAATFDPDVTSLDHVKPGMLLEGVVTNVAGFGAFVDIGVHQDGLVHVSELATRFVADPREVVRVGQVVTVKVLTVDPALRRIGLSVKQVVAKG
ncbi:MAG: RNA-binding transcriptional accessory protein [Planctomycetes bacterium]|nr:RNA-binding transcriptional accessory protein [Planctomycetota bacterium]